MSFFKYWTRSRANQLGVQAVERGKEHLAAWDGARAEAAFLEALEALNWSHGEGHVETVAGPSGLAAAAWVAGDWERSRMFTEQALAITDTLSATDDRHAQVVGNLMQLDWHVGELGALIESTTALLGLPITTWHATARFHLAVAHRWLGQYDLAKEHGSRLVADGGSKDTEALFLAGAALDAGQLDEAEAGYRTLIAGYGDSAVRAAACSRLASVVAAQGGDAEAQLSEAEAAMAQLSDAQRASYETVLFLDRARVTGRLIDAEVLWERFLRDYPGSHAPCLDALHRCVLLAPPSHEAHEAWRAHAEFLRRVYPPDHRFRAVGGPTAADSP